MNKKAIIVLITFLIWLSGTIAAFDAAKAKWDRDPQQYASKSYCSARQELSVLIHLKHTNIVPLIGICVNPLAIVLELAPLGALDTQLKHYRRSGDKISAKTCQLVVLQIAKALEYLHQQHIIYRDLKSENVLVWQFPEPFSQNLEDRSPRKIRRDQEVHVRLVSNIYLFIMLCYSENTIFCSKVWIL